MRLSFQKIREKFGYKTERLPMMERYATPTALTLSFLHPFVDLIIGERGRHTTAEPPFFASYHRVVDAPKVRQSR